MPSTLLDVILNNVKYAKSEITLDVRDYSESQKQRIIDACVDRGLSASSDGKYILVRDFTSKEG